MDKTPMPIMRCIGIPTTKILSCGIVRARIPKPIFVSRMANVTGMAIFMPVRKIPVVKFAMMTGRESPGLIPMSGTSRKLSARPAMII